MFCYVVICVCFDCKCKNLKRLGENINTNKTKNRQLREQHKKENRTTGYPAHEPPRIYVSYIYSRRFVGWMSCISVFVYVFLEAFLFLFVYFCFCLCFRLAFLSFCIYNRQNIYNNINKQKYKKLRYKYNNIKHINSLFPSRNLRYIYSRSGRGLDILYFCCLCFSRSFVFCFLFCVVFLSVCFLCSPNLFKFLHLQSKKHI